MRRGQLMACGSECRHQRLLGPTGQRTARALAASCRQRGRRGLRGCVGEARRIVRGEWRDTARFSYAAAPPAAGGKCARGAATA